MGVKHFYTKFGSIGNQEYLRMDFGYRKFFDVNDAISYKTNLKQVILKKFLKQINGGKYSKGELEEEEYLIDMENVERRMNNLINVDKVVEIFSDKNILGEGDIVVPKLQPKMGNLFLNKNHNRYLASSEFIEYKITNYNATYLYYLLTSNSIGKSLGMLESGKTHRRVSPNDLLKIKIPEVPQSKQDEIVKQIEPIEEKIRKLKSTIQPIQEVINKVFAREFSFSENLYQEFGRGMTASSQWADPRELKIFSKSFSSIGNNKTSRFSTRYHNPPTKNLMDIMKGIKTIKVKDVVLSNDKGIQPDYDTDGTVPVIKIANMKNLEIDFSECEFISETAFALLNESKKIKRGDIIICGTGKASLGKIDIYESDDDTVTTVDNLVIRLSDKYNKLFFVYFFRSILGYFQIERDFTGATNQIHLYRDGVSEFLIPDIPLSEQERIVEEIQTEINKQNNIRKEIQQERNKIDEIIESAIK